MNPGIDPTTHYVNHLRCLAPEKADDIERLLSRLGGLTFADDDQEERIFFQADSTQKIVTIGHQGLMRLWANCLAYFCIYTEIGDQKRCNPEARDFDLTSTERFRKAQGLLRWAVGNEIAIIKAAKQGTRPQTAEIPDDLPKPFASSDHASDESCADELCLVALGWIMFHEITHIEQGHKSFELRISEALRREEYGEATKLSTEAIQQEKEADLRAADWVLSGVLDDPLKLLKRGLGVMVGLVWLASREVYKSREDFGTHPPAYDRLYQVLKQYFPNEGDPVNDLIWNSSQLMLNIHLQDYSIPLDEKKEFRSFEEAANEAIERIIDRNDS